MMSRFYKANKELVDRQYRLFKSKVNMTYAEMVAWKKNKCSRAASIKIDEVINRVTRLLKKPKNTWTQKDFNDSKKVVSYISRATKIQDSLTPAKRKWGCMKGKNFYALRNWAYDREKEKKRRPRRNPITNDLQKNKYYVLRTKEFANYDNYSYVKLIDFDVNSSNYRSNPKLIVEETLLLPYYKINEYRLDEIEDFTGPFNLDEARVKWYELNTGRKLTWFEKRNLLNNLKSHGAA